MIFSLFFKPKIIYIHVFFNDNVIHLYEKNCRKYPFILACINLNA